MLKVNLTSDTSTARSTSPTFLSKPVVDIQVCWEGEITFDQAHERKKHTYNPEIFKETSARIYPNKTSTFEALTVGGRRISSEARFGGDGIKSIQPKHNHSVI